MTIDLLKVKVGDYYMISYKRGFLMDAKDNEMVKIIGVDLFNKSIQMKLRDSWVSMKVSGLTQFEKVNKLETELETK